MINRVEQFEIVLHRMMSLLKASFFLLTISPLAQACTKLMDGKDKTENKKEIVELLRKLADMLEEQTPITPGEPIVDKTTSVDHYPVFDPYPVDDIGNPNWRNPERYSPRDSTTRNVGHPPAFGIGIVKDCALWDDGSCGAKAAKGDDNKSILQSYNCPQIKTPNQMNKD